MRLGFFWALRSAWPRVRARADRRPLLRGLRGTTRCKKEEIVARIAERLSREARAGAEVFEKPSGTRRERPGPSARALTRARHRLPPVRAQLTPISRGNPREFELAERLAAVRSRASCLHAQSQTQRARGALWRA
jgi:hypothetical protein